MKRLFCAGALVAALVGSGVPGWAQTPVGGAPGWSSAFTRLFGNIPGFMATGEFQVQSAAGQPVASLSGIQFSYLEGRVRMEFDLTHLKARELTPQMSSAFKQMGLDRMINITRPDRKEALFVYPALKAYLETPLPEEEARYQPKDYRLDKKAAGDETLDGQPCKKQNVTLTDPKGVKRELTVWESTKQGQFPLQIRVNEGGNQLTLRFRELQLKRPDSKEFESPKGFTRYPDFPSLMQAASTRMGGASGKK